MTNPPSSYHQLKLRLGIGLAFNAIIILTEFIGGYLIHSIGIMSDAGHNLVDQGSLFLALYAHVLAIRPATGSHTFGYHRAGIVSAFINGLALLLTAAILGYFAIIRIISPMPVSGGWMIIIALTSFLANLTIALLLQKGAIEDINIRGAFWHMLADAWVSLGVVASGIGILLTGWNGLDPLISLILVGVIVKGTWPIFRESLDILLESTPPGIKTAHVIKAMERIDGVCNVHDLHIWAVEPRMIMLTCHVIVDHEPIQVKDQLLSTIQTTVAKEFGIHHLTVQLETQCAEPTFIHCDLNRLTNGLVNPDTMAHHAR